MEIAIEANFCQRFGLTGTLLAHGKKILFQPKYSIIIGTRASYFRVVLLDAEG
jgi:hypothetical protein